MSAQVLSRPTSRDDFFMADVDAPQYTYKPAPAFQTFVNNPAAVMYAMANAWNFGHLSSDSLSSFANSSPRGGNISRNSSQNSMGGDAPSMDSPEPGGARGMFQTWEDGISSSGSAGGGEEDTRMPKGNEGNTLLSSLFTFLDSLLAQNGATEETPSVESDIRPESFFPKVC